MVPVDIVHDRIKISEIGCKIMQEECGTSDCQDSIHEHYPYYPQS